MGAALYIVPERDVEGFEMMVDGKELGHSEQLDQLAGLAGVRPLMEFFSQDAEELAEFLEAEGIEPPAGGVAAEQWFTAEDGLISVRGILAYLEANPGATSHGLGIIEDLKAFESVLERLGSEGIRWHLAVDF
jgi:hypothetical protein